GRRIPPLRNTASIGKNDLKEHSHIILALCNGLNYPSGAHACSSTRVIYKPFYACFHPNSSLLLCEEYLFHPSHYFSKAL
ncbi:hypothetical protein, partial [Porphyromonas gulae]|uniref:hypothetical protein n=1 Tax=Porphyromonas gulae TaxID=111105 RepID=UPI001F2F3448